MVSSVSSSQLQQIFSSPSAKQDSKPAVAQQETPKDSVQLSAAGQKALSGDVDHDGDSH
jgi:hypothetical protein